MKKLMILFVVLGMVGVAGLITIQSIPSDKSGPNHDPAYFCPFEVRPGQVWTRDSDDPFVPRHEWFIKEVRQGRNGNWYVQFCSNTFISKIFGINFSSEAKDFMRIYNHWM